MKAGKMSRTMVAATGLAMTLLIIAAIAAPTCRRGLPKAPVVIVDTVVVDTTSVRKAKESKTRRDSTKRKKKVPKPRQSSPPSSRNYLDEPARE